MARGSAKYDRRAAGSRTGRAPEPGGTPASEREHRRGELLAVRVRPRAGHAAVGGSYIGVHGPALVVAVREPAVDGRANQAVLAAVARALNLPRSRVLLRTGERGRDKLLTIVDPPADLADRVRALRGGGDSPAPGGQA